MTVLPSDITFAGRLPFAAPAATLPTALAMDLVYRARPNDPHAEYMDYFKPSMAFLDDIAQYFGIVTGGAHQLNGYLSFDQVNGNPNIVRCLRPKKVSIYSTMSFSPKWAADGTSVERIRAGIFADANNYVCLHFDRFANQVYPRVLVAGAAVGSYTAVTGLDFTKFTKIGVSIVENVIAAMALSVNGWVPIGSWTITAGINLKTADLTAYRWGFDVANNSASSTTTQLSDLRISPYGAMGVRDQQLVTYENGEPIRGPKGELYFTGDLPAATPNGGGTGAPAQFAVFEMDILTYKFRMTGSFEFSETVSSVTTIYGGGAGKLAFDRMTRQWYLFTSTYNSPSVAAGDSTVRYAKLDYDPRFGRNIIASTTLVPGSHNDADIIYDAVAGLYYLVYNSASLTPTIRKASTFDGLMAATPVLLGVTDGEGSALRQIGGVIYWMTQIYVTPTPAPAWRCWKASDLSYVGTFIINDVSTDMAVSHPNIVPVGVSGGTKYLNVTFDATPLRSGSGAYNAASNGNIMVYESQVVPGKEYADVIR